MGGVFVDVDVVVDVVFVVVNVVFIVDILLFNLNFIALFYLMIIVKTILCNYDTVVYNLL